MFELIFGIIWTLITSFVTYGFYGMGGDISVNGRPVSQEEFNEMLLPKLVLGLFFVVGIFLIAKGAIKICRNIRTSAIGKELYGVVLTVNTNGTYVNGRPQLDATVFVYMGNNEVNMYTETVGFDWNKYKPGDYIKVKHCKGDINITEIVPENRVPYDAYELLRNQYDKYSGNTIETQEYHSDNKQLTPDVIIINGVEYQKKNS